MSCTPDCTPNCTDVCQRDMGAVAGGCKLGVGAALLFLRGAAGEEVLLPAGVVFQSGDGGIAWTGVGRRA